MVKTTTGASASSQEISYIHAEGFPASEIRPFVASENFRPLSFPVGELLYKIVHPVSILYITYVYTYIHMYTYIHIYMISINIYIYIHIMCMYVCMYIYIYIYAYDNHLFMLCIVSYYKQILWYIRRWWPSHSSPFVQRHGGITLIRNFVPVVCIAMRPGACRHALQKAVGDDGNDGMIFF